MITAFDSLYAGHVDMEEVGYGGTPVNDRWFSDDHLASAFDKMTAMAHLMERTGALSDNPQRVLVNSDYG